jgi:hypothetical protein
MARRWTTFLLITVLVWLFAHSVAFFSHEFAHTFSAQALGWKSNPFDLDWGTASPMNLVLHQEIDENVDYQPVFDSGHAIDAGLIALAGTALGNLIVSLGIGLGVVAIAKRRRAIVLGCFGYWVATMSVANLLSYVPLRVFTSHADMHTVEMGFGWTPMQVLLFVGLPYLVALLWFFLRFQPRTLAWLFPDSVQKRYVMVFLTSITVFGFFCLGGLSGYGETSHYLSMATMLVFALLSLVLGMMLSRR